MAAVFALFLIVLAAIAFSIVLDKDAGEMLPITACSIILYLYIFYCINWLQLGMISLYLLIGALFFCAFRCTIKEKVNIVSKITPAFAVFCCTSVFFLLYTADNLSVHWDELRVWSAMPKAIYETKQLQLGSQALIFDSADNMQTYPPALPLFANFFLAAAPAFRESYIFLAYALFVSVLTIQPFRSLRWNQWYLCPVAFIFVTCAPFVLTLHGGDGSYFYESLFIDPVLGFAAGYVFYLATSKPFRSKFSIIQFSLALAVLVMIKDTGILFAALSLLCALTISLLEEKQPASLLFKKILIPVCMMCLPYFLWKGLLHHYSITNHVSLHIKVPAMQVISALIEVLTKKPIINLVVFGFSFLVYALILLILCAVAELIFKPHSRANNICVFGLCFVSFLLFSFGYINIFPYASAEALLDLSFYRYFTTLTSAWLILCFLRYLPAVLEAIPQGRSALKLSAFLAGMLICFASVFVLSYWESDYSSVFLEQAKNEKDKILEEIPVDFAEEHKRVYLLMAEKEPNIFHHRFYFELIGSGINIENFYNDTDMYDALGISPEPAENAAEIWYQRLQNEGYDYIYIYSVNDAFTQAFAHLGLGEAIPGQAYPVNN